MNLNNSYLEMINHLKFDQDVSDRFVVERAIIAMFLTTQMIPEDQKTLIALFQKYEGIVFKKQKKH